MHTRSFVLATMTSLLAAQVRVETFDGPNLPAGWTVRGGTWQIANGRAQQVAGQFGYLTLDGVSLYNVVVEADVYWTVPQLQFGGVCVRHAGAPDDDCVMARVQGISWRDTGFTSLWISERPVGPTANVDTPRPVASTRVRLIARGATGTLCLDSDQDGVYDSVVGPITYFAHTTKGLVGIAAYSHGAAPMGISEIDNFAYYDAVLVEAPGAVPRIGTSYRMELQTQAIVPTPFVCAAAFDNGAGNGGIGGYSLGDGRRIPLVVDPMFDLSLRLGSALGLTGVTDAQGLGPPSFRIPNNLALIGLRIHVAGVTITGAGIGNISNEHAFVVQR